MSMNILNDISSVYLEQVVGEGITIQDFKKKRSAQKQKKREHQRKLLLLAEQEFIKILHPQKEQQDTVLM
jgi:hypothetical protein